MRIVRWGVVLGLVFASACTGAEPLVEGAADTSCLTGRRCVDRADCGEGERCNTALEAPECQLILCGRQGSACSETTLCEEGLFCARTCGDETGCEVAARRIDDLIRGCGIDLPTPAMVPLECTDQGGRRMLCVADCYDAAGCGLFYETLSDDEQTLVNLCVETCGRID